MSFNTKMTAIADEIRTLSNTTDSLGLDEMASHIGEANSEIDSQADLISQIQAAVDNLPEAGGGGASSEMISITIEPISISPVYYFNSSGEIKEGTEGTTFQALNGIVIYHGNYALTAVSGDYTKSSKNIYQAIKFNSDGGIVCVLSSGGSDA